MEEMIQFDSGGCILEGLLGKASGDKGAIITHPHPLYGGDMHNNVVEWITHAYQSYDYTTLRFNFRGVGGSQGVHDNGIGEQKDVLAALSALKDQGVLRIDLTGYSFGSWINAMVAGKVDNLHRLILVSPPVAFIDFDSIGALSALALVVTGSMDDIAPASIIRQKLNRWNRNARFEVIEGADHFYYGCQEALVSALNRILK